MIINARLFLYIVDANIADLRSNSQLDAIITRTGEGMTHFVTMHWSTKDTWLRCDNDSEMRWSPSLSFSFRTWNLIVNEIVFPWKITMEKARNWFSNFPHTKQNKTRQTKQNNSFWIWNMNLAFVRELIEVLLLLLLLLLSLLVLHVTCEQLNNCGSCDSEFRIDCG